MIWYSVHVVMVVRFKDGEQTAIPAWENVYLISAEDANEAADKAEAIGKANEGDSDGTFYWEDRPAEWIYRGVRKVIEIASPRSQQNDLEDGTEVTYQTLEFENKEELKNYMDGTSSIVKIVD